MTRKQLDKIGRTVNRLRAEALKISVELKEYPTIAFTVGGASDDLYKALKQLDNIRDEMMAPVHP